VFAVSDIVISMTLLVNVLGLISGRFGTSEKIMGDRDPKTSSSSSSLEGGRDENQDGDVSSPLSIDAEGVHEEEKRGLLPPGGHLGSSRNKDHEEDLAYKVSHRSSPFLPPSTVPNLWPRAYIPSPQVASLLASIRRLSFFIILWNGIFFLLMTLVFSDS